MIYVNYKKRTDDDKRSIAMFTFAYHLEEDGKYDEAIEAYWESIKLIDTEMRSLSAFWHLINLYDSKKDIENLKFTFEIALEYSNYFNQKEANDLIDMFPQYKDDILLCLETNENFYPSPYWDKYNPLWRPNNTMLLIEHYEYMKEKYKF